jgi:RimJ/RimL family protein N-acetyltransferase
LRAGAAEIDSKRIGPVSEDGSVATRVSRHPPERIDVAGLVLRQPTFADAELIAATVRANLGHLAPWMPWAKPEAATVPATRERLTLVASWAAAGDEYSYLVLGEGERLLGIIGLHRRVGPGGIEIGYWLASDAVGHGYMTTAATALTAAALALPDVDRVEIHCDVANIRSQQIPQRLGYRLDRLVPHEIEAPAETGQRMIWIYPPDAGQAPQ